MIKASLLRKLLLVLLCVFLSNTLFQYGKIVKWHDESKSYKQRQPDLPKPTILTNNLPNSANAGGHDSIKLYSFQITYEPDSMYKETKGYNATVHTLVPLEELEQDETAVVTAYFSINSKYPSSKYLHWMSNMLVMKDCMFIFTSHDMILPLARLRSEFSAKRTVLVSLDLNDTQILRQHPAHDTKYRWGLKDTIEKYNSKYNLTSFWDLQILRDPRRRVHRFSFALYSVWLSKPWFVMEALEHYNHFSADFITWIDVGCYRNDNYKIDKMARGQQVVSHPEIIPQDRIAFMAHKDPIVSPSTPWYDDKFGQDGRYFYTSGTVLAGRSDAWKRFYQAVQYTMQGFLERRLFIGEDQLVFQSACNLFPNLCAYSLASEIYDKSYFGLRLVLQIGNDASRNETVHWWYPPPDRSYYRNLSADHDDLPVNAPEILNAPYKNDRA